HYSDVCGKEYSINYLCTHSWKPRERGEFGKGLGRLIQVLDDEMQQQIVNKNRTLDENFEPQYDVAVIVQCLRHNHAVSREMCGSYAENRRINDPEILGRVEEFMKYHTPFQSICQFVSDKSDQQVTNKYMQNIITRIKREVKTEGVDERVRMFLDEFVASNAGNTASVCVVDSAPDSAMAAERSKAACIERGNAGNVRAIPEVVDTTQGTNYLRHKLFFFMVIDAFGVGQFVQHAFIDQETNLSLAFCVDTSKKQNSRWDEIQAVMVRAACFACVRVYIHRIKLSLPQVDKDMKGINVLQEAFPSARTLLCQFHVLKHFKSIRQEYTTSRDSLIADVRAASNTPEDEAHPFEAYFMQNWDSSREMWVAHLRNDVVNLNNKTNNRLENAWGKLKPTINVNTDLEATLEFVITSQMIKEATFEAKACDARTAINYDFFATKVIMESIPNFYRVKSTTHSESCNYLVDMVSATCSCAFQTTILLTCRHLISLNKLLRSMSPMNVDTDGTHDRPPVLWCSWMSTTPPCAPLPLQSTRDLSSADIHRVCCFQLPLPLFLPSLRSSVMSPRPSSDQVAFHAVVDATPPLARQPNPLERASWASVLTTQWLQPLVSRGACQPLELDDVWAVCPQDSCDQLQARLESSANSSPPSSDVAVVAVTTPWLHGHPGMFPLLMRTFVRESMIITVHYVLYVAAMALQPYLAQAILTFIKASEPQEPSGEGHSQAYGLILVALLALTSLVGITCLNFGFFMSSRVGANVRSLWMDMVFQKALALSCRGRQEYSAGELVTLLSVDSERAFQCVINGPWLFVAPLAFVLTLTLVAVQYSVLAAFAGAVLLVLILVVSVRLGNAVGRLQKSLLQVMDARVQATSEVLEGIRVVKLYAWETALLARIQRLRADEVRLARQLQRVSVYNATLLFLTPVVLGAVVLAAYVSEHGAATLSVTDVFTLIAIVNICRMAVNVFPSAVASIAQAKIACKRLDTLLAADEIADVVHPVVPVASASPFSLDSEKRGDIQVVNASWSWPDAIDAAPFQLHQVNLDIPSGSLVMVIGGVGAGKSSLLQALLGEMLTTGNGTCVVNGTVAYAAQESWLCNVSIQDNILMGRPLNKTLLAEAVSAAQLDTDLVRMPNGIHTMLGERGSNLSGGQRARICMARALYQSSDCNVLLLDDPLSAVDPKVANAIFHEGVAGVARRCTRVMVLNSHFELLMHADVVVVMDQGRVVASGPHKAVLEEFPDFQVSHSRNEAASEEKPRQTSDYSATKEQSKVDATAQAVVSEEDRVRGNVAFQTYKAYFDEAGAGNGVVVFIGLLLLYAVAQFVRVLVDWWQAFWIEHMHGTGSDPEATLYYGLWYLGLVVVCSVLMLVRGLAMVEACVRSSSRLHDELLSRVLRAPINEYFDTTPVGRILNRFSNDLDQMDMQLPQQYHNLLQSIALFVGCLAVCAMASVYVALAYIPMLFVFAAAGLYFKRTSREVKRLEGITRTPILALLGEMLQGVATIRASGMQERFVQRNRERIDTNTAFYFTYWAAGRWLAVRLDWLSVAIITLVSLYLVLTKGQLSSMVAGISMTYSLMLTSMVQWVVRSIDQTDNAMTSVERLLHFRSIPVEEEEREQEDFICEHTAGDDDAVAEPNSVVSQLIVIGSRDEESGNEKEFWSFFVTARNEK
ncbi:TPA: LOW QUALITY PROTEIN: hypothetical protein N0F65_003588, partial [Lagenidium giganteum]